MIVRMDEERVKEPAARPLWTIYVLKTKLHPGSTPHFVEEGQTDVQGNSNELWPLEGKEWIVGSNMVLDPLHQRRQESGIQAKGSA